MGNCCAFEPRRPKFEEAEDGGTEQRVVLTFKQPMIQPAGLGVEAASYGSHKVREELRSKSLRPGI